MEGCSKKLYAHQTPHPELVSEHPVETKSKRHEEASKLAGNVYRARAELDRRNRSTSFLLGTFTAVLASSLGALMMVYFG